MNYSVYNSLPINYAVQAVHPVRKVVPQVYLKNDLVAINRDLDRMLDKNIINDMVNSNPVVTKILRDKNIKPVVDVENFKRNTYRHSVETRDNAMGIYNHLPFELKKDVNPNYIQKGALLHDIGKVLIPAKILNKNGRLTPKEAEIVHQHAKLSEALLSTQNIEPEVLNIVKYHHQNNLGSGYPEIKNTRFGYDLNTEVVALADKYSALKEQRPYKPQLSDKEALSIIKKQVDDGEINPKVYNALVGFINNSTATPKSAPRVAAA